MVYTVLAMETVLEKVCGAVTYSTGLCKRQLCYGGTSYMESARSQDSI